MNQYITLALGIGMTLIGLDVLIRRESGFLNPSMIQTRFGQVLVLVLGSIWIVTGGGFIIATLMPEVEQTEITGFAAIIATVEFFAVFIGWLAVWVAQQVVHALQPRSNGELGTRPYVTYQRRQQVLHLGYGLGQVIASHYYDGQEVVSVRFGHDIHVVPVESVHLASEADGLRPEADAKVKEWMVEAVKVRSPQQQDLRQLLAYGWMTPYHDAIQRAYDRTLEGELIFLVAEAEDQIIGQVWVDLTQPTEEKVGIIRALFVLPTMQNLGLGTRLLEEAEAAMRAQGLSTAEVSIEQRNRKARHVYARLGYQIVKEQMKRWSRTTADGKVESSEQKSWIMRKAL